MNEAFNLFASQVIVRASFYFLLFVTDSPSISLYRGYFTEVKIYLDPIINIDFPDVLNMFTSFYRWLAILASQANTNYIGGENSGSLESSERNTYAKQKTIHKSDGV